MQFNFAVVAALFGAALAAPVDQGNVTQESLQLSDFSAHKANLQGGLDGPVRSLSFKLTGSKEEGTFGVACQATAAEGKDSLEFRPNSYRCEGGEELNHYSFELNAVHNTNQFSLAIIHQTGFAYGYWANVEVPTYCHAGGDETMACQQVADVTADLHL